MYQTTMDSNQATTTSSNHQYSNGTNNEEDEVPMDELPQQLVDLADAPVPTSTKGIRACKRCGLLKTVEQFIDEGCENCPFLEMVSRIVVVVVFPLCSHGV